MNNANLHPSYCRFIGQTELVMDVGCRNNRWAAFLYMWQPGCSPLVPLPSQEVGGVWASLSLAACKHTSKGVFQKNYSISRASKIYGHKAFQTTHSLSAVAAQHYSTPHTLVVRCGATNGSMIWFLPCDCEAYAWSCYRQLSVRLSVCLSDKRVHCDKTK